MTSKEDVAQRSRSCGALISGLLHAPPSGFPNAETDSSNLIARHRATGRVVAIKHLGGYHGGSGTEEVLREARFLEDTCGGGGGKPFVVGFHGVIRVPGTLELDLRLVMEHVGPSLHDLLRRRRCPRPRCAPPCSSC
ncbi:hypothetical protein HU200_044321 [Digitaria exilis]|uniref:Uncharacterized protein n=1 Tax=Digitaria exilis TaxID=1010633 RepID=A0A835EBB9_9POAL|nr:hypothetical protein HU200_044321 [Digitaria exilis]